MYQFLYSVSEYLTYYVPMDVRSNSYILLLSLALVALFFVESFLVLALRVKSFSFAPEIALYCLLAIPYYADNKTHKILIMIAIICLVHYLSKRFCEFVMKLK